MKKILVFAMILCALTLSLAGCSNGGETTATEAPTEAATDAPTEAPVGETTTDAPETTTDDTTGQPVFSTWN